MLECFLLVWIGPGLYPLESSTVMDSQETQPNLAVDDVDGVDAVHMCEPV